MDVAKILKESIRNIDICARYGGEEFAIILPETPLAGGTRIAEELRAMVASSSFEFEHENIHLTISLGVAELPEAGDLVDFIRIVDEKLYDAKDAGRDRVIS